MQGTIKRGAVPPKRFLAWFGRNQVNFFKVRLCTDAFLRRKAERCLVFSYLLLILARKDNSLPCATLFPLFSESKKRQKIFAAQTPPRKRGYVEDFALNMAFFTFIILTNATALLLWYVRVAYGKIAARQARGWGWHLHTSWLT